MGAEVSRRPDDDSLLEAAKTVAHLWRVLEDPDLSGEEQDSVSDALEGAFGDLESAIAKAGAA
jgi:hypothetical protein